MTNQEIFDKVAGHLLEQGKPSVGLRGECLYRGLGGMKCAIGCLIPDSLYHASIENVSVDSAIVRNIISLSLGMPEGELPTALLRGLQQVHDSQPPSRWRGDLRSMAYCHGLSSECCDEGA